MCLVEVEDRPLLKAFASEKLTGQNRYAHNMLIDGNDDRGIDVALLSRHPIRGVWSHIDDKDGNSRIFSRDCLEVQVEHPKLGDVFVLVNHFKSKGYGVQATSNARRKRQAERVAELLKGYDLKKNLVIVAGDLNDTPDSAPLAPLLGVANLYDVLAKKFPNAADRWTYHYNANEQIDYLLVSKPLRDALNDAGVFRRGIHDVATHSAGAIQPLPSVTGKTTSASDHGAVWAEFVV